MSKNISGSEYPLSKIFSKDFDFVIPPYQRPYSWTVDQTSELIDDLYDFYISDTNEDYFLGSIVLIKEESSPSSEVIDGQQRLTTLTIIFAALASMIEESKRKDMILQYILEPGNPYEDLEPKPRLTLRERDRAFFEKYVYTLDFETLLGLDTETLDNEAQQNIQLNSNYVIEKLNHQFENYEELDKFIAFLLKHCFLVAVSTPNRESAFRVFSVMNNRGLDLQPTDIIKADVIGKIDGHQNQEKYNERWEDMEVELGRNEFNNLFSYIRMIYAKEKAKRSILEEFRTHVLTAVTSPKKLIEEVLEPYSDALGIINNANYEASTNAQDINGYLKCLNRIDNSDWIPPAILFLSINKNNPEYVLWFFKKLERLAAFLHICAKNINERIARYSELINALQDESNKNSHISEIELKDDEKKMMTKALDGEIYELSARRRNYVILRLDAFLSDGAAFYDPSILTIEHVLPQTVDPDSEWAKTWPDHEQRKAWTHKIANLVPLNRRRNSQAQNFDFNRKKSNYFGGKNNVSSFVLTTQVLNMDEWTPEIVEKRQMELLKVFSDNWEL